MRRLVVLIPLLLLLIAEGCNKEISVLPPPRIPDAPPPKIDSNPIDLPVSPNPPVADPTPSLKPVPPPSLLDQGDRNFREGKYSLALPKYDAYLKSNPQSELRDRIFFNIGLSRILADEPARDLPKAKEILRQLVKDYPGSSYKSQAKLILDLLTQVEKQRTDLEGRDSRINQLQEELKRLKEIDMKRRPSRPADQ
jgi:hypothetical protein